MANVPLKVLLFCTGLLVAGGSTAYYKGVFSPAKEQAPEMASLAVPQDPAASEEQSSLGESSAPALPNVAAEIDASQGAAQSPDSAGSGDAAGSPGAVDNIVVPTFDVVRVEPDGSMVVAGRAVPGAEVEVLSGSSVLATTRANDSGEFAAVLDKALKPGEHNIVLRGTSPDTVATSVETAIVSIPSGEEGQVVALVQQPGEPSRLITVPQPRQPSHTVEKEENGQVASDAETNAATAPQDQSAAREEQDTPTDQGDGAEALARADADDEASGNAVVNGDSEAVAEGATSGDAANVSPFIEAVEIDGREIFVAGRAEPGRRIRVYVNDILLGQTDVSPEGSFLIEAERELPAGDYIIRADVLGDDGSTVIARAAVPFERPAVDRFAAVAGQATHQMSPGERDKGADTSANSKAKSAPVTGDDAGRAEGLARVEPGIQDRNTSSSGQHASAPQPEAGGGAGAGGGSNSVVLPPLEPSDGSVIIRRGDTLWHISRRVYGQGVRYSTIYLANQDQIRNPNLIYPGQIFKLPEETEQGERANLDAVGAQVLSPDHEKTPGSDS